jgi:peptidoglycan hydrolase-like protein with peptidoglycan-binding domain
MKHLLNNLTEEEKNAIREQHTGGMKIMNENFSKLVNTKLGDVKPLVNEQSDEVRLKKAVQCFLNKKGYKDDSNQPLKVDGLMDEKTEQALSKYQSKIKVYPADGIWGSATQNKMPSGDVQIFKQCISDEGDIFDKGLHFLGLD